ncbi:acetyl esterase/lipase [Kibdelosporangium banguiense]|uniref:Acetyl esterase/lipase n=1 Tax=Kibdelosporangium banguiense TaxID=1365924 RepID=A0ABS4T7K3_9PSEU|nr:alpha/beta hydrolase [Kibdelosporangium banguiense]MBP2320404.1 acetyl esterase/lipase [Kibdelosporangium banguiense]
MRTVDRLRGLRRAKDVTVEAVGPISVRIYKPTSGVTAPSPALLWIHGGGYVMGTAALDDFICRHFVHELGIIVASVDYRLAPEYPFPTPLHDCHDALTWLADRPDVDATRIVIGGASAGGGLAAALALLARDRAEVRPVFQLLTYPMLDDRTVMRIDIDETHFRGWDNTSNRFGWQSYLSTAPGSAGISALAAPARHEDLSGLPPAWMGTASLDLFYEEDIAYANRLTATGVHCEQLVVDGAFHGFDLVSRNAGISQEFRAAQTKALANALT